MVLHHLGRGASAAQAVLAAYHEASRRMAGTPGLLGNQLMTAVDAPDSFVVVSRWSNWDAFAAWEGSAGHKEQTAPLRNFRDTSRERPFEIYRVLASY
ncbi:antibiotic biosynthesis monooxygenase family protein [Streptomyces kronopolitis]|uniref:antibiotic biosynthesis monooxygenase family protein n=1 Tax=Streptomyces kronopolitis TaxID=1612435 RepID=UPI003425F55C